MKERGMIKLTLPNGGIIEIERGMAIIEAAKQLPTEDHYPYLCARVGNEICGLDFIPDMDCDVTFLDYLSNQGREV